MEPPPRCERQARAAKRPAASGASARNWARASKLARSRRKEEVADLQLQVGDLQVCLEALERAHSEVSESDKSAVSTALIAKSACLDQYAARLATERRNEELKTTTRELLADAEKVNRVFNKLLRHQRELDRLEAGRSLQPLVYDPSSDDELFQTLELRQRSQQHDTERVFRDAGISRDTNTLERTELVDDLPLTTSWEGVVSPMMLQAVLAKLTPFPKEVVVAGMQQFNATYCCVCQSKPVANGTVWWVKTRYRLSDAETGDSVALAVHGVLSFLHEGERARTVWTAASRSERTSSQGHLPSIDIDERSWSVVEPVALRPGSTSRRETATRMQSCFQLIPRVSGAPLSMRSQDARRFFERILPSLRSMLRETHQEMENFFCDEWRRRSKTNSAINVQ